MPLLLVLLPTPLQLDNAKKMHAELEVSSDENLSRHVRQQ